MKKSVVLILLMISLVISSSFASGIDDFNRQFRLMPQPKTIQVLTGKGIGYNTLTSVRLQGTTTRPVLYGSLQSLPVSTRSGPGVLVLDQSAASGVPSSAEGYEMKISAGGVVIKASTQAGLFYG